MNNRGFTLLEMLIALALVGILLTATMGITARLMGGMQHSTQHMQKVQDVYYAINLIEKDISSYHHGFSTSVNIFQFNNINSITWAESQQGGINEIAYEIIPNNTNKDEPTVELYRFEKDAILEVQPIKTKLLEAKQITFSYYNDNMQEKLLWLSQSGSPIALKIIITDNNNNIWERVIPLPITE